MGQVIAIDGPAGAGKSTIARNLAARLGYVYIDSGAMYRAVALSGMRLGIPPVLFRRYWARWFYSLFTVCFCIVLSHGPPGVRTRRERPG